MLSSDELERYARHIVLREVGGPGQAALKEASVLVIGAGGLGAPALMYLAAAGIGTLGVVDDDVVSLSNLQRQIIHETPDIGKQKVDSAAERIAALNPHVKFAAHATRLNAGNAMELIGGYDLGLDGSDNFETRRAAPQDEGQMHLNHRAAITDQADVINCGFVNGWKSCHEIGADGNIDIRGNRRCGAGPIDAGPRGTGEAGRDLTWPARRAEARRHCQCDAPGRTSGDPVRPRLGRPV